MLWNIQGGRETTGDQGTDKHTTKESVAGSVQVGCLNAGRNNWKKMIF